MRWLIAAGALAAVLAVGAFAMSCVGNARVVRDLRDNPNGERAQKVMLITLPSGKTIPVNYLRDGDFVYAGADFSWWRELRGDGGRVTVWIRGEELTGLGRAVESEPELRASVFERLRPTAPDWAGTLVEVRLDRGPADVSPETPPGGSPGGA